MGLSQSNGKSYLINNTCVQSVPDLEKNGILLEKALGKLQQEIDLTINRVDRLSQNDFFGNPNNQRPIPATRDDKDPTKVKPLYEEKEEPVRIFMLTVFRSHAAPFEMMTLKSI